MEFWEAYLLRATQERAIRVSLIVGTVLVIINQGDLILAGSIPDIWKIPLTYSVPYFVSSYSSAAMLISKK
tara:strand:- start:949 stop:1161 length:213 start_codon:yes stop_codon:yes gene_type:complete